MIISKIMGLSAVYKLLASLAAASLIFGGIYIKGRVDGRDALQEKLKQARVKVLETNKDITDEILNSDDDALCALLGGCSVSDEPTGD